MIAHSAPLDHAVVALVVAALAVLYAHLWSNTKRRQLASEAWSFGASMGVLLLAIAPPAERLADRSFTWHMAQHLVLLAVVAPLLLFARPVALLVDAWPAVARFLRRARLAGAGRRFGAAPRTVLALAVLFVVHAGRVYDVALDHRLFHDVQHLAFVAAGVLLWSAAVTGPARRAPARIGATFGVSGALTLLSLWIMALDAPLSDRYAERSGVAAALDDQRTGAALMWVGMITLTLPLLLIVVWQWAATEQRIAERAEAITDRRAAIDRPGAPRSPVG